MPDVTTLYQAYRDLYSGKDTLPDLTILETRHDVDIIPADPRLNTVSVDKMPATNNLRDNNRMLMRHLTLIKDCLGEIESDYDFILIDSHPEGAVFALEKSKKINIKELIDLARSIGLSPKTKDSKKNISAQLVQYVDKRIDKSLDELKAMNKDDLIQYFEKAGCHQDELIDILKNIDLKARVKTRKDLVEFAAIQISSLGIFERLSNHEGVKTSDKSLTPQISGENFGEANQQINSGTKS